MALSSSPRIWTRVTPSPSWTASSSRASEFDSNCPTGAVIDAAVSAALSVFLNGTIVAAMTVEDAVAPDQR